MPLARPRPTRLYHFTHVENILSIADSHALHCDDTVRELGQLAVEVAKLSLKEARRTLPVPCGRGETLGRYVPFYFAPRSPMMYLIGNGWVKGYVGGQGPLVYFVTSVERIVEAGLDWVFTDRHPVASIARFSTEISEMDDRVDWPLMRTKVWKDTPADSDRMSRRQAEFDVHGSVPLDAIEYLVVRSPAVGRAVQEALRSHRIVLPIECRADDWWYYGHLP